MKVTVEVDQQHLLSMMRAIDAGRRMETEVMRKYPFLKKMAASIPAFTAWQQAMRELDAKHPAARP